MPILKDNPAQQDQEAGFSLIEVIVALVIVSVLTGIVGLNVRQLIQSSRLDAAQDAVEQIVRTTRAQSTFLGEFVSFDMARQGHPHERSVQTIFFDLNAGSGPDGICPEGRGRILLDTQQIDFTVSRYTCEVIYRG